MVNNNSYGLGINIDPKNFQLVVFTTVKRTQRFLIDILKLLKEKILLQKKLLKKKMYVRNYSKNKIEDGSKMNKILLKNKIIKKLNFDIFDIYLLPFDKYYDIAKNKLNKNKFFLVKNEKVKTQEALKKLFP